MKKEDALNLALKIVIIIGMILSLLLIFEHFSTAAEKFCSFGPGLDCGIVNKSPYATLDGITYMLSFDLNLPVPEIDIASKHWILDLLLSNAFLGFLTLVLLFSLLVFNDEKKDFWFIKKQNILWWVRGILIFGVAYGFYLFLVQHFILKTYCVFCLGLDVTLVASLILSFLIKE